MDRQAMVDIAEVVETQEKGWFGISTFLLCCLIMLADGFDNQAINYCAPSIIREWHVNRASMTPVFDVSIFGWMTGSVVFSMLADRVGRRRSILFAVLLFGVFTLAVPLATNLVELASLRFFATLGIGGAMPMAIALVADYARAQSRGFRISMLYLGYTLGSSGGGLLAAELIPLYGWRAVFLVGGVAALAIGAILLLALPESVRYLLLSRAPQARILAYARKLKPSAGFDSATRFVIQEPAKKGLPVKHLFTEGRATMTTFLWFALGFSFVTHFFLSAWLATLLSDRMSNADAVRTAALFQLGAAFSMVFGWLIDRLGIRVIIWTMLLGALPVAAIGLVQAGSAVTMALALASGILVLGGNIGLNAISGMIYPTFIRSTGTGAAFAAARIGALIGPALAGALIALHVPLHVIFVAGAVPMLAAAIATFLLNRSITPDAANALAATPVMAARH